MLRARSSEMVSSAHPDMVCGVICDTLLDLALSKNKHARCGIEAMVCPNKVILAGEIGGTELLKDEVENAVRSAVRSLGYTKEEYGFNADTLIIENNLHQQSADIAQGVKDSEDEEKIHGAGDIGIMFGYACNQTEAMIPLHLFIPRELMRLHDEEDQKQYGIRPDAKCEIAITSEKTTLVMCVSHDEGADVHGYCVHLINKFTALYPYYSYVFDKLDLHVNPTGKFVIMGPFGDSGLNGRKIVAEQYGGACPVGGGAFCLPKYVIIDTPKGPKRLSDLKEGDEVLVDGKSRKIIGYSDAGKKHAFRVFTENGYSVDSSLDHNFKVVTKDGFTFKKLRDLTTSDYLVFDKQESFGSKVIDDAYMLGFITGDGWLSASDNSVNVKVPEFDMGSRICDEFQKVSKGASRVYDLPKEDPDDCQMYKLFYCDKTYRHRVEELGMEACGALNKRVPKGILEADKNSVAEFLRGVFDSDGTVSVRSGHQKSLNISVTSSSFSLISGLKYLLLKFGINTQLQIVPEVKEFEINGRKTASSEAYQLSIQGLRSVQRYIKEIGFSLKRKQEVMNSVSCLTDRTLVPGLKHDFRQLYMNDDNFRLWLRDNHYDSMRKTFNESGSEEKRGRELTIHNLECLLKYEHLSDELREKVNYYLSLEFDRFESIQPLCAEDMADIEVEDVHEYVANGFKVHNSGKDSSKVDRSAAYMARYLATEIIKNKAKHSEDEVTVGLCYAIGEPQPISIELRSNFLSDEEVESLLNDITARYDLSPQGICEFLHLKDIKYVPTAKNGHFGVPVARGEEDLKSFPWEAIAIENQKH